MTEWVFEGFDPTEQLIADFVGSDMDKDVRDFALGLAALPDYDFGAGITTALELTPTGFDPTDEPEIDFGLDVGSATCDFGRINDLVPADQGQGWPIYHWSDDKGSVYIKVELDHVPDVPGTNVSVNFSLAGNAVSGQEFTLITASPLVIPYGDLEGLIQIDLIADTSYKKCRELLVDIDSVVGATKGEWDQFKGYIRSSHAPPVASFTSATQSHPEDGGPTTATVELHRASRDTVTVPFTAGGTAGESTYSFTPSNGELVFTPGQTTKNITITPVDDDYSTGSRTVVLSLALLDPAPIAVVSVRWPGEGTFWNSPQNRCPYSEFIVKESRNNNAFQGGNSYTPGEGPCDPTSWISGCVDDVDGIGSPYEIEWNEAAGVVRHDGSVGAYYVYIYQEAADAAIEQGKQLPGGCIRHSFEGMKMGIDLQLLAGQVQPINIMRFAIRKPPSGMLSTDVHAIRYYNRFNLPPWYGSDNTETMTPHGAAWEWVSDGTGGYLPQLLTTQNLDGPNDYAIILGELGNEWWEVEIRYDGTVGLDIGNVANVFFKIWDNAAGQAKDHPLEGGLIDRLQVTHDAAYGLDPLLYQPRGLDAVPGLGGGTKDLTAFYYVPRGGATNDLTDDVHTLTITDDEDGAPMEAWLVIAGKNAIGINAGPIDNGTGGADEAVAGVKQLSRGIDNDEYDEGSADDVIPAEFPMQHAAPTWVGTDYVGPALAFGKAMLAANPGIVYLLLPSADRDSGFHTGEWVSPSGAAFLDAVAQMNTAIQQHGAVFSGIICQPGLQDTDSQTNADAFRANMITLISELRSTIVDDVNGGHMAKPFIIGTGATLWFLDGGPRETVYDAVKLLEKVVEYSATSVNDDIGDDVGELEDGVTYPHWTAASSRLVGTRYATRLPFAQANLGVLADVHVLVQYPDIVDIGLAGSTLTVEGPVVVPDPGEGSPRGDVIRFIGGTEQILSDEDLHGTRYTKALWVRKRGVGSGSQCFIGNPPGANGHFFGASEVGSTDDGSYGHNGSLSNDAGLTIENDAWVHVAITYNGSTFVLYKDGVSVGSTTTGIGTPASLPVSIGNYRETFGLVGYLDDIRIYNNRVLDADQIQFIYDTTVL